MFIGKILNGTHPILKTESENLVSDNCIVVGFENALKLFPEADILNKEIKPGIFYCFDKEETSEENYLSEINDLVKILLKRCIEKVQVKNIVDINLLELNKDEIIFYYESDKIITITQNNIVYYINKSIANFFKQDLNSVHNLLNDKIVLTINNGKYENIAALFKNNLVEFSYSKIIKLYGAHIDIDTYFGYLCLHWIKINNIDINFNEEGYRTFHRAFEIEDYLSNIEILVDEKVDSELTEVIIEKSRNGYVKQHYNGTDKVTGRMYANNDGFSLQTLPKKLKNIIIAEPNSYLVEFDYRYFEFEILKHICNLNFNGDPHCYTSELIFGDKEHRKQAKGLNYSILYGKSINKIIEELSQIPKIKEKLGDFKSLISPIEIKQQELIKFYNEHGYIENYFNRKIKPAESYRCLNNYIQSTAADFLIIKIDKIRKILSNYHTKNKIVLQNHDSILFNLRIKDLENSSLAKEIKGELQSQEGKILAKVDIKFGKNWKELE